MILEGRGLHGGRACTVVLRASDGASTFGRGDDRAAFGALRVEGRERHSVAILPSGAEIAGVEHLFAAVLGAAAFAGVHIDVDGDELPLLDGAARAWLDALPPVSGGPSKRVIKTARYEAHGTTLTLAPDAGTEITVAVSFDAARFGRALDGSATWRGDRAHFRDAIATARTFGAARELAALRARGLAAHVPEGSVVALDVDDARYAPRDPDEPIRHKLLDALGDLAALGGAIAGRVHLDRPSHRGTGAALSLAIADGAFVTG